MSNLHLLQPSLPPSLSRTSQTASAPPHAWGVCSLPPTHVFFTVQCYLRVGIRMCGKRGGVGILPLWCVVVVGLLRASLFALCLFPRVRTSHPRHHAADDLHRHAASSHTRVLGKSHAVCARAFVCSRDSGTRRHFASITYHASGLAPPGQAAAPRGRP